MFCCEIEGSRVKAGVVMAEKEGDGGHLYIPYLYNTSMYNGASNASDCALANTDVAKLGQTANLTPCRLGQICQSF